LIRFPRAFWETKERFENATEVQWLAPNYATDTNPERLTQTCYLFNAAPPGLDDPTLVFFIYGPTSLRIASLVKNIHEPEARDEALLACFHPYYSRLPNYDESNTDCKPSGVVASAWVNDELAGYGSYTISKVGCESYDEDLEAIRHGMPEKCLWFCGEHTARWDLLGTTTGAYGSGEALAKRIVEKHSS